MNKIIKNFLKQKLTEQITRYRYAKIILTATLYLLFKQFKLDDNYCAYLQRIMISNKVFRTGIEKTPYQKTYKLIVGVQSR